MLKAIRPAFMIVRREVRDQFRDWRIIFPIVGLTVIFPFIMNWTAQQMLDFTRKYGASIIGDRMVPFLLMIVGFFPISISLVIALESFVGEKERSSIEPLLNSPLEDWQIYLGKLVSSIVPPLVGSYLGMAVYSIGLLMNHVVFPGPIITIQVVILTTVQAIMMVSGAVVVSTQATSIRAANLLSSFIVIPVAFLIQWESLVMFWGNNDTLWWVVLGMVVLTFLLVRIGLSHFQREELLGREIDVLKFRWMWDVFSRTFISGAKNPMDWYRRILTRSIRKLALPMALVTVMVLIGLVIGRTLSFQFPFLIPAGKFASAGSNLSDLMSLLPGFQVNSIALVWWQNVRVLILSMLLGLFSFGVLGILPLMATMAVTGYLAAMLSNSGMAILPIAALFLPHGIFEIPAAILATAAVLRAGAILATPTPGKTISEVWISTIAEWVKIMLGVVVPMLVIAAVIEITITPRLAIWIFSR